MERAQALVRMGGMDRIKLESLADLARHGITFEPMIVGNDRGDVTPEEKTIARRAVEMARRAKLPGFRVEFNPPIEGEFLPMPEMSRD